MLYLEYFLGGFINEKNSQKITPKPITSAELREKLERNEVLLVDVRERTEYTSDCIEGACSIPADEITPEKLPGASTQIVLQCSSGNRSM